MKHNTFNVITRFFCEVVPSCVCCLLKDDFVDWNIVADVFFRILQRLRYASEPLFHELISLIRNFLGC